MQKSKPSGKSLKSYHSEKGSIDHPLIKDDDPNLLTITEFESMKNDQEKPSVQDFKKKKNPKKMETISKSKSNYLDKFKEKRFDKKKQNQSNFFKKSNRRK